MKYSRSKNLIVTVLIACFTIFSLNVGLSKLQTASAFAPTANETAQQQKEKERCNGVLVARIILVVLGLLCFCNVILGFTLGLFLLFPILRP